MITLLTKAEAIEKALANFDQRCRDTQREFCTRVLQAEANGGSIDPDAIELTLAEQRAAQQQQREALRAELERELADDRLVRVRTQGF